MSALKSMFIPKCCSVKVSKYILGNNINYLNAFFLCNTQNKFQCRNVFCSTQSQQIRKPDWNRAVSDAEKIVGYPTSYLTLRSLFSDEMSNIAVHMRKLVGSSHPLLKTAKRLIYNGRNNMQTRGLIVLLLSKAAGLVNLDSVEDKPVGISHRQRSLAEITEMIHTAHLIHKGVVNLAGFKFSDGTVLQDMEFGNKLAILSGDYLLANACLGLASLRNSYVVEYISTAIADFMEAEFIGKRDSQGNSLPTKELTMQDWEDRNFLAAGSLMANSCKSALLLAGHSEDVQKTAFEFGREIAFAWQLHSEIQPFTDLYRYPPGTPIDLTCAPVILHLRSDLSILDIIDEAGKSLENCDFKKIHSIISQNSAVEETKILCLKHVGNSLDYLNLFEESDARTALENIVNAFQDF